MTLLRIFFAAFCLAGTFAGQLHALAPGAGNVLPAVEPGHWAYAEMQKLADAGLVQGDFHGKRAVPRVEFAAALQAMPSGIKITPELLASAERLKAEFDAELKRMDGRIKAAEAAASLTEEEYATLEEQVDALDKEIRGKSFAGGKIPEVTSTLGITFQDITGYGMAFRHGTALNHTFTLSMSSKLSDGSFVSFDFKPGFSPSLLSGSDTTGKLTPPLDDGAMIIPGPSGARNSLMDSLKLGYLSSGQGFGITVGSMFMHTSIMTLSNKLSNRPVLFERSPYAGNGSTKSTFENQFLSGVPKRAPEESEHAIMGALVKMNFPMHLESSLMYTNNEGQFDPPFPALHEYMATLGLNGSEAWGGNYTLMGYNRSNDRGELNTMGTPADNFLSGLQNNTLVALYGTQKIGPVSADFEGAQAYYDTPVFHVNGPALRLALEGAFGGLKLDLDGYSISPNYLVQAGGVALLNTTSTGLLPGTSFESKSSSQANGLNDLSYYPDPVNKGQILHDTVVSDPTIPMINTSTYGLGTQFNLLFAFFNIRLQNSMQQQPTSAVIVSSHFLNGQNLTGGGWFSLFSNNYVKWDPRPGAKNASAQLDAYNRSSLNPAGVTDTAGTMYYGHAYKQLEGFQWRTQQEQILSSDPVTGKALNPSLKNVSYASIDSRMRLNELFRMKQDLFLHLYQDITTVNDSTLVVPSMDANNLFVQTVGTATLVYNVISQVNFLLNTGYETWRTDRVYQPCQVEYYEPQVGAGMDWDVYPGKLSLYLRVKGFKHHDARVGQNDFIGRQMWWELKSFF